LYFVCVGQGTSNRSIKQVEHASSTNTTVSFIPK